MSTKQTPPMATHYCKNLDAFYHADALNQANKAGMWLEGQKEWVESAVSSFEVLNCPDRFKQVYLNARPYKQPEYHDKDEEECDYNGDGEMTND